MAVDYVLSINQLPASCPKPFDNPWSMPMEGPRRQSPRLPSLRGSIDSPSSELYSTRSSFDQQIPNLNDNSDQNYRRQSLQLSSDRRASLAAEADNRPRRCSLPNPITKGFRSQKKRVVGNGVYKLETLPWHESSLRQAIARQTHERKEQMASPLPLINLHPGAEARLRDVLGEEGYAEWRRKHRASYLLSEG